MSCFVMSLEALATLANGLEKLLNMGFEYCGVSAPVELHEALNKTCTDRYGFYIAEHIYQELYKLNMVAYNGRYMGDNDTDAPVIKGEKYELLTRGEYGAGHWTICPWHYKFAKLITCFVYQVSEDATREAPLKLAMERLNNHFNSFIVYNSPDYTAAPWGKVEAEI